MRFRVGYQVGLVGMLFIIWLSVIIAFALIRIAIFVVCVFAAFVVVRWAIAWIRWYARPAEQSYLPRHKRPLNSDDGSISDFAVDSSSSSDSPVERSSK